MNVRNTLILKRMRIVESNSPKYSYGEYENIKSQKTLRTSIRVDNFEEFPSFRPYQFLLFIFNLLYSTT